MTRRVAFIAAAGVAGVLLVALGSLYLAQRDRAMPNTSIAGVDVGRMTADEIRAAIQPLVSSRETEPVELDFEDDTFRLHPTEVGYAVDVDATVAAAMARGREGFPGEIGTRVRSLRDGADLELHHAFDTDELTAWVDEVADTVDREVSPGSVEVDPASLEVLTELPHGGASVRRADTADLVADAIVDGGTRTHPLPVDTEPQRVPDAAVEEVAAQVSDALAGGLELHAGEESLAFTPTELASLIEVVVRDDGDAATLELTVSDGAVAEVVGDVGDRFSTEPVNARYVTSRTPPRSFDVQGSTTWSPVEADIEVEPGSDGTRFDLDLLTDQLEELLRQGARSAELRLATIEPELPTERAEALAPTHLLSTFTTYHPAGQARVVNIQRLADTVDDTLLLPGEQFSINGISGRRTCAAGYREAGMILRGELVDVCGGGTSQFGTTTFNAAFFSGVQLDQWKAHSWYFTRYPMGREATLNYPDLDVKFSNTTDAAIVVRTTYTASSITVSLYGRPIAESVSASHSGAFAHRPFSEQRRDDPERCEGETSVLQDGAGGFSVDVAREVTLLDGSTDRLSFRTVYVPRTRIVEVGTMDCAPEDDDEDDEDDEDEDEDDEDDDG